MKNPIQSKKMHVISEDLNSMHTVTTISLFGIPIYKASKNQSISVSLY